MSVTIKDIAKIAGVSRATVDKVLHDRPGVRKETRKKVQQVIDDLEYRPNIAAKALKLQQKKITIGVVLLKLDSLPEKLAGINAELNKYKDFGLETKVYIVDYPNIQAQVSALEDCRKLNLSGVIVNPLNTVEIKKSIQKLTDDGIPVITVNSDIIKSSRKCFIGQDMMQAGKTAGRIMGRFLSGKGKVAAITGSKQYLTDEYRLKGFSKILKQEYPDIDICKVIETRENPTLTYKETAKLLNETPDLDGIFVTSGAVTGVGQAIKTLGFSNKLTVISFDLYDEIIEFVKDGIIDCTIGQDLFRQGQQPIQIFFEHFYYNKPFPTGTLHTAIDIKIKENIDYS